MKRFTKQFRTPALHQIKHGVTLMELIVVTTILAILASTGFATYSSVIKNAKDKTHLISLVNYTKDAVLLYKAGYGSLTWEEALSQAATEITFATGPKITTLYFAQVTLLPVSEGPSLTPNSISYALAGSVNILQYSTAQIGVASRTPSGNCAFTLADDTGILANWVTSNDLGAACIAALAFQGEIVTQSTSYLAPYDFGPPTAPQVTLTTLFPTVKFTIGPPLNKDLKNVIVVRDGVEIATLEPTTDTEAAAATTYSYEFINLDKSDLVSSPTTIVVTTLPAAPTNLTLNYTSDATSAIVNLAWDRAVAVEISGYRVYKNAILVATISDANTPSIELINQSFGEATFAVQVYNISGASPASEITATLRSMPPQPNPVGVTLSAISPYPTFAITPSTSPDALSIQIFRDLNLIDTIPALNTTYTDTTANLATEYDYYFTTISTAALESISTQVQVTTLPASPMPLHLQYTVNNDVANVQLTWASPSALAVLTGYHIYKDNLLQATIQNKNTTTIQLVGQNLGHTYTYSVTGYNLSGDGESAEITALMTTTPTPPTPLIGVTGNSLINLQWPTISPTIERPITGYNLTRSINNGPYIQLVMIPDQAVSSFIDTTVSNGTSYSYQIASYGPAGSGSASAPTPYLTPILPPNDGTLSDPVTSSNQISFAINFTATQEAPIEYFIVKRNGAILQASLNSQAKSYSDATAKNGTSYIYTVHAVNPAGASAPATTNTLTPNQEINNWSSIAYGGNTYVAVANNSQISAVSTDAINWTRGTLPLVANWSAITYGAGLFIAVAADSNIAATSTDGINWAIANLPATTKWSSVAYGEGTFVAVAPSTPSAENPRNMMAASSTNGVTWTARTLPYYSDWTSITYGNSSFVVVASSTKAAATSTDGASWTQSTVPAHVSWHGVAYGNGTFVAISAGTAVAATSPTGSGWTLHAMPRSLDWSAIAFGNGNFVVLAKDSNKVITSTNGVKWATNTMPSVAEWASLTYGSTFVAIAEASSQAATSSNGVNWTARVLP